MVGQHRSAGIGKPWNPPSSPRGSSGLPELGAGAPPQLTISAAVRQAQKSGHPVVASGLTTQTQLVTAQPDGVVAVKSYVLPVRVRQARGWVPVSTVLRQVGGRLEPAAIPGDGVSFSAGGTGPMAEIWQGAGRSRAELELWWPGRLPAPEVAGSSATYRNVLSGVDLVLSATSLAAGGFDEVLVVRSAAAARKLAQVRLRVSGLRLKPVAGGGLRAPFAGGAFVAPPSRMWDSSAVPLGSARTRTATALARRMGASLAPPGAATISSAAGPAAGARLAPLGTAVSGRGSVLALVPDAAMLASPAVRYPLFLDPDVTTEGDKQDYDIVQSDDDNGGADDTNCTGPHFNSSSYPYSPIGYDNFEAGDCEYNDTDRALYRIAMPVQSQGSDEGDSIGDSNVNLLSAAFQTDEVYSSDCSSDVTVTVSWIAGFGSSTGWGNQPGLMSENTSATSTVDYDSKSCDDTVDNSAHVAASFNVLPDIDKAKTATNMTFRLWENGNTDQDDHKQFIDNPDLYFTYIDTPDTPSALKASTGSNDSGNLDCDTTDPDGNASASGLPALGTFTSGPYLWADFSTGDANTTTDQFKYWIETTSGTEDTTSAATFSGTGELDQAVTSAFAGDLTEDVVVAYEAQASITYSGTTYSSAWSPICYVAVFPEDPAAPTVTANFSGKPAAGTTVTYTITQSPGDTASEFVWGLDQAPPTSAAPAAQTCTSSSSTCTLSGGSATVTVSVPSPGPHEFFAYELDAAGNESGMTDADFDGAGDAPVSYTSGSSLAANFATALTKDEPFDNRMISTQASSSGAANGDGNYESFDEAQLKAAGWNPGGTVTVDGATFTLPSFGSSNSGDDNLLAANQTIGAGAGTQGSAVVFLATSDHSNALVPGQLTGLPGNGLVASDDTVPGVLGGTEVTGYGCTTVVPGDQTLAGDCRPASGTVKYENGCPDGSSVSYDLTVPDWVSGPVDLAAVYNADRDTSSGQQADSPKIYAFAVPTDPDCTIASVTLPDVGDSVGEPTGSTKRLPALHIFGVAVRNNTTATPEVNGTSAAAPSGQGWTGAVESPIEDAFAPPSGVTWGDQTFRVQVVPTVSVPANSNDVRIQLSDPGFLSGDGDGPLEIGAASIATGSDGAKPGQAPSALKFGGSTSVTIPEGGEIYSDPLPLPFAITAGKPLLISIWIENSSLPVLPLNTWPSAALTWWASSSPTPNETGDATGTPFSGSTGDFDGSSIVVSGLDVTTGTATTPPDPTVVVAGDNIIDGLGTDALSDALDAPSKRLAGQLYSQGYTAGYGSVDAGIESNQILADDTGHGGESLVARLDRDVLSEPDVGTVVLDEGLEDLLADSSATDSEMENALQALTAQLNAFGVTVIVGTLTPCDGYTGPSGDTCSSTVDGYRTSVNGWLRGGTSIGAPNCVADFDAAVSNGDSTESLATTPTDYNSGDDANLSFPGYAALASPVNACGLSPSTPAGIPLS
ncbi:MAG TPA: hypothetical protein VMA73_21810 [Streptosporangiaceae bacterium]|nr:hypothetical protein [Streptosporangiaceae bacterium]